MLRNGVNFDSNFCSMLIMFLPVQPAGEVIAERWSPSRTGCSLKAVTTCRWSSENGDAPGVVAVDIKPTERAAGSEQNGPLQMYVITDR